MAISSATFTQIIRDSVQSNVWDTNKRLLQLPLSIDRVITISGARRTGKTSIMFRTIQQLREDMAPDRLLYINFEDDRLFAMAVEDFDTMLEAYFALYPANRSKTLYFFLDEIQRITGWESFIRRLHDQLDIKIFITGSSASLLGKEIATSLRGRTLTYEVFPLSFKEFLVWKKLPNTLGTSTKNAHIKNAFQTYFETTAFPELIDWPKRERIMAMQEYIDLIIYRDVAERLKEANTVVLKHLIHHLLVNASNKLSVNGIYKNLKGQGMKVSKDSLYQYINLLEDVYAIYMVPVYTRNQKVQQRNPRKVYMLDHGLKMAVSLGQDQGALLENIIFLELRRKYKDIYYWQEEQEVDFIVQDPNGTQAINVSAEMQDEQTSNREINGLKACMQSLGLKEGTIVTYEREEELQMDHLTIHLRPAWKWLLENQE